MEQINWLNYQYQLLRYEHDAVTGEFANLGMIYFDPASQTLLWRFEDKKYARLSHFFGDNVQGSLVLSVLRQLNNKLRKISEEGLQGYGQLDALTRSILTPDDNGWYFSQVWSGRHFDHRLNFDELYERIIGRYQEESSRRQDDAYAWKNVYKKYFDRYNLTTKLHKHRVETDVDKFDFQHSCKNGVWHCLQSLSFALKNEGAIKDKIYKWDGFARELTTAREPMKVYLLSILPDNPDLIDLLKAKLNVQRNNVEIRVIAEEEAEAIARELKEALTPHS